MNSLTEVIKISKAKSSAGQISLRFNRMCARLWPTRRILLFSYLDFRVYFACYPPESFKNNLVDLHLVEIRRYKLSFFAKPATKSFLTGPPFLPNLKKVVTRMDTSIRLDTVCLLHNAIIYLVEFIGHENF